MAGEEEEEDIVKTETAKLKAKIEELQNAVSESEAAAKAAQTDSERISALLQAYEFSIDLVGYTIMITDFAYPITKVKNESWLTEGRKVCLRAIIIMEELVTGFVETDFASVEEKLLPLEEVIDDDEKWRLVRKTGFAISTFCDSFMENSKWKRMSGLYSHVIPVRYRRGLLLVLFQRLFQNPYSKMSFSSTLSFLLIFVLLGTERRP